MKCEFVQLRDDGTIDARLGPEWPIFNDALADAISTLPPRGSTERRLSTYWIDNTLNRLARLREANASGPIAGGNAYSILFSGDVVSAAFDYGDEDSQETMSAEDFIALLDDWRTSVQTAQQHETREVPQTYRRNPWP